MREHPGVRLRVANDNWANLFPLLRRRELDLAVIDVRAIADEADFHITPLTRRQGYLAVRPQHPLLRHNGPLTMGDVLRYPFITTARFPSEMLRQVVSESATGQNPSRSDLKSVPSIACESLTMGLAPHLLASVVVPS